MPPLLLLLLCVTPPTAWASWGKVYCGGDADGLSFPDPGDPCAFNAPCTPGRDTGCIQECQNPQQQVNGRNLYVAFTAGDCHNPNNPKPTCLGQHTGYTDVVRVNKVIACTHVHRHWRCSAHGDVNTGGALLPYDADNQRAMCTCDVGWVGWDLQKGQCFKNIRNDLCSGHGQDRDDGKRYVANYNQAQIVCKCDVLYNENAAYTGTRCDVLKRCPRPNGALCNGHGKCLAPPVCTCDSGYGGEFCCVSLPGGKGVCGMDARGADGKPEPRGTCASTGQCQCNPGFGGPVCCPQRAGQTKPCGDHGTCSAATGDCVCQPGHTGRACEITCAPACHAAGGTCVIDANDVPYCECKEGYFGPQCAGSCVAHKHCSGHGVCVTPQYRCLCDADWGGPDCSFSLTECLAPNDYVPLQLCAGRGICSTT